MPAAAIISKAGQSIHCCFRSLFSRFMQLSLSVFRFAGQFISHFIRKFKFFVILPNRYPIIVLIPDSLSQVILSVCLLRAEIQKSSPTIFICSSLSFMVFDAAELVTTVLGYGKCGISRHLLVQLAVSLFCVITFILAL